MNLPKIIMGTSPFIGAGQFGERASGYYQRFYENPEQMTSLFVESAKHGVTAVQLLVYEPLVKALEDAQKEVGDFFVIAAIMEDFKESMELVSSLKPQMISLHANFCDSIDPRLDGWIDEIKSTGAAPIASTHNPAITIPMLEKSDFDGYLAPLNPSGFAMNNFEMALGAIQRTQKKVIAMKTLGAGGLLPEIELFKFVYAYADAAAVGITSVEEMDMTYSIMRAALGV